MIPRHQIQSFDHSLAQLIVYDQSILSCQPVVTIVIQLTTVQSPGLLFGNAYRKCWLQKFKTNNYFLTVNNLHMHSNNYVCDASSASSHQMYFH